MNSWKSVWAAAASAVALATAATPAALAAPPTAEDYGRLPAFSSMSLSPDGKTLAALTSPDGKSSLVSVWKTDAMDQPPRVFAGDSRLAATGVRLVKNDRLLITTRQTFTDAGDAGHLFKIRVVDLNGKEVPLVRTGARMTETEKYVDRVSSPQILSRLPADPQHILVLNNRLGEFGDVLKVNVYTGERDVVLRGSEDYGSYQVDLNGEVRARQELDKDGQGAFLQYWIRHPDTNAWEQHFRWYAKGREPVGILGFSRDKNIAYVSASRGGDKTSIYEYDIRAKKFLEPLFQHKMFDANGVITSTAKADYGEILGFVYSGETDKVVWVDPKMKSIAEGVEKALGVKTTPVSWTDIASGQKTTLRVADGVAAQIVQWSDDREVALVEKSGPKQPPEYYLLTQGSKLTLLGRARPSIDPASLGDARLVQYTARDGMRVPAFLTTPPKAVYGAGPYPSIIVPHGGPWARDNFEWDDSGWTQYFASRGYAVLQPQFRGSMGWGQKLWLAGDGEWGQKMQDDKDDGAKWLIEQKIAAPERIAMHGYSYGGYSAFAAGVRPNGLYQCSIAGAGVAELGSFQRDTREERFNREFQGVTIDGLDPLSKASTVSVPMLIYHGDRDQRVPLKQSKMFVERLRAAGKPFKYVELKDMGHSSNMWSSGDAGTVLGAIESFLRTDCGPGGL